jgi:MerR family transcriptional regulator, light-induced transcriptional regulator
MPRGTDLWTSAEVAEAFRVGVSSIKRWTDEGELESIRTPGGHRRYTLPALFRFASIRSLSTDLLPPLEQAEMFEEIPPPADVTLHEALVAGDEEAVRKLVTPHVDTLVQRASFLDRVVGDALRDIGKEWERGELSIEEEHRASHIVADAVDRLRPRTSRESKLAILACPPAEAHDLPLRLVRLVFEWSGWRTELLGAELPWPEARHAVDRATPSIIAFSARSSDPFHHDDFESLVDHCAARQTIVITGGSWARGGQSVERGYYRFRSLRGFEKWLRNQ